MRKPYRSRRRERGAVLVMTLFVSLVMLGLSAPFMFKMTVRHRTTEKSYKSLAAVNLAEAGIERAIWELNYGDISSWSGTLLRRDLTLTSIQASTGSPVGDVAVEILNSASDNPIVTATGRVPWVGELTLDRSVRVVLKHGSQSHFNFGIFGDEGFELHGNAYTDSYNSDVAPYDPFHPGTLGDVGTNAGHHWDVVLLNNTLVNGDAITGYQSDPLDVVRLRNAARVTGVMKTLAEPKLLPAQEPPFLTPKGAFLTQDYSNDVVITESGKYSAFTVGTNTKVTISGKVTLFIDGDFTMRSNSTIEIAPGSEVELVLGNGVFSQSSNTAINNLTQDPKKLAILGTADFRSMIWRANTQFWGVVYVPEAYVYYAANADLFGSLVTRYLYMSSSTGIHYDESLGTWDKYGVASAKFIVKSWQER